MNNDKNETEIANRTRDLPATDTKVPKRGFRNLPLRNVPWEGTVTAASEEAGVNDNVVRAEEAVLDQPVTAAHGEVTGKPSLDCLRRRVTEAVQGDYRFDDGRRGNFRGEGDSSIGSSYCCAPYCVDILVPDDDGALEAIVSPNVCAGKYLKIGFTWDGEDLVLNDGEPEQVEQTTVYAAFEDMQDAVVRAGDFVGHPFRGNQHGAGGISNPADMLSEAAHKASKGAGTEMKKGSKDAKGFSVQVDHGATASAHKAAAAAHAKAAHAHREEGNDAAADYHEAMSNFHGDRAKLAASSHAAAKASKVAEKSGSKADHKVAARAHTAAAAAYKASKFKSSMVKALAKQHADKANAHMNPKKPVKATEAESDVAIHCSDSGSAVTESDGTWKQDEPVTFQWMPAGVHTINASWGDRPIKQTVQCEKTTAGTVQASFSKLSAGTQKPFICVEHREQDAAGWPTGFEWRDDPKPGVYCTHKPSALGVNNVNGRMHRSFSPSFITNAAYSKATCSSCKQSAKACECGGQLVFPDGVKGSATNPADIIGVHFSAGSLTNKPAFREIAPVRARENGGEAPVTAANPEGKNQYSQLSSAAETASTKAYAATETANGSIQHKQAAQLHSKAAELHEEAAKHPSATKTQSVKHQDTASLHDIKSDAHAGVASGGKRQTKGMEVLYGSEPLSDTDRIAAADAAMSPAAKLAAAKDKADADGVRNAPDPDGDDDADADTDGDSGYAATKAEAVTASKVAHKATETAEASGDEDDHSNASDAHRTAAGLHKDAMVAANDDGNTDDAIKHRTAFHGHSASEQHHLGRAVQLQFGMGKDDDADTDADAPGDKPAPAAAPVAKPPVKTVETVSALDRIAAAIPETESILQRVAATGKPAGT